MILILIISIILLCSTVTCIIINSTLAYFLYFLFSSVYIMGVLAAKFGNNIPISMMESNVIVLFIIAIIIDTSIIIGPLFGIDPINKLHKLIIHDRVLLLERDFYWSAPERHGMYITRAYVYRDCVTGKIYIETKRCEHSGHYPEEHPDYNKFLADVKKLKDSNN